MVIRFSLRRKPIALELELELEKEQRLESHPSGLNRTDARRLSSREVVHRERMLRHLERLERTAGFNSPSPVLFP
jgi:hypothetical protein